MAFLKFPSIGKSEYIAESIRIDRHKNSSQTFKKAINNLTVQEKGDAEIRDNIKVIRTRPFVVKDQGYLIPKKSVFNRIIGDSHFELVFSHFLEDCEDVISFAKNYLAVHFKIDYVNADGDISNYYPDFFVKLSNKSICIVETKGLEDLDVPLKMTRLSQWCEDINRIQKDVIYDFFSFLLIKKVLRNSIPIHFANCRRVFENTKKINNFVNSL